MYKYKTEKYKKSKKMNSLAYEWRKEEIQQPPRGEAPIGNELLVSVMQVQSSSFKTKRMRKFITAQLKRIKGVTFYQDDGNIYATKGVADIYPCAVSHTDTVHRIERVFTVKQYADSLYAVNGQHQQVGIGGDDKVGIYICLRLLMEQPVMKCAFFRDEEVGCVGSSNHDTKFFLDCGYVMQGDRRGRFDITETINNTEMVSEEFRSVIGNVITKHNRKWVDGMMTDVEALAAVHNISMFNCSCGYYNPHCSNEYINIIEVHETLQMFTDIISVAGLKKYPCEHEYKGYVVPRGSAYTGIYDRYSFDWDNLQWAQLQAEKTEAIQRVEQKFEQRCPHCNGGQYEFDDTMEQMYCWTCGYYYSEIVEMYGLNEPQLNSWD